MSHASLSEEYLRLGPLQTRIQTHQRYSELTHDVEQDVIDRAAIEPTDAVLDVGCGTAAFLARLSANRHVGRLCGLDASPAAVIAASAIDGVEAHLGDAAKLPFDDTEFDVVCARHMLYHVDDPAAAIREAKRVLRPGGRFVALVNHPDATPFIAAVVREQAIAHGITPPVLPASRVHSDNLPGMVGQVFDTIEVYRSDNALLFPTPEPVALYGLALMNFYGVSDDDPRRSAIADAIVAAVADRFAREGAPWRDPKGYVVCVATEPKE